jgi:hypothetical protein
MRFHTVDPAAPDAAFVSMSARNQARSRSASEKTKRINPQPSGAGIHSSV